MREHRASSSRILPSKTEVVVVLAVISGGLLLLAPLLKGPVGERIPSERPNESRRLIHPAGFSIVVPPNWKTGSAQLTEDSPILGLFPAHPLPVRYSASITVMKYDRQRPRELDRSPDRFRAIRFQGQPAYEAMEVVRKSAFPDQPALSQYTLYIQRQGDWYLISYSIFERRTELPPSIREYINTFRIETAAAGAGR